MSFPNTNQSSNTYSTNPGRGNNGPEFGTDNSATEFSQQRFPAGQHGNTTDAATFGAGGDFYNTEGYGAQRQQGTGRNDFGGRNDFSGRNDFAGNTTDANTFGAGGDFGGTGRHAGQQRDLRDDNFNGNSQQTPAGDAWDRGGHEGQTRSKPTMGERVKGTMEQAAGGITRNKGMQERGKELKQGEFDQQQQY